MQEKGDTVTVP